MALTLSVGLAAGMVVSPGSEVMSAVKQALADPLSIFADRSPGRRAPGALTQTKPARPILNEAASIPNPTGNTPVLPIGQEAPPSAFSAIAPPEEFANAFPAASSPLLPANSGPLLLLPTAVPLPPPQGPILGPPVIGPPTVVPPTIVPPETGPPPTIDRPTPPVSPIPEPASWVTMIFGFFATGSVLRRSRRFASARDRQPGTN